jgi:type I restriction enzyme M protein
VLTPGRYVGAADAEDDDVPFGERFASLKTMLEGQFKLAGELETRIRMGLQEILND